MSVLQINMLLTFSTGEDCPCPTDIQEELYDFHNQLQLHCGEELLCVRLCVIKYSSLYLMPCNHLILFSIR